MVIVAYPSEAVMSKNEMLKNLIASKESGGDYNILVGGSRPN